MFYYFGTVTCHMSEEQFWRTTPRKLFALLEVHNKLNSYDEEEQKEKEAEPLTLEEFRSWNI